MAAIQLQPLNPFDFKQPDEWPMWKSRFEQYRGASGLSGETEARQVSTLLYCMGPEAGDVLATTTISDADRAKYETVLKTFASTLSSKGRASIAATNRSERQQSSI